MSKNQQFSFQKQMVEQVNYCKQLADVFMSALQLKLNKIKKLNKDFEANQQQMEEACTDEKQIESQIGLRSQFSDQYYYCHVTLQDRITKMEDEKALANQNARQNAGNGDANRQKEVKLPKIEITPFYGHYEDWAAFHDMFHSLIHTNDSIHDVQKLHYLKTNMKGDAEMLLKSITVTDANYAEAWNKLKKRFDHKRFIVDSLLKNFFKQPAIMNESHSELKKLIDKSSEIIQSLKLQAVPVAQWDVILVHVIVSKLDSETHKQWELKQTKDELPTFAALEEFIHGRWQSLEMIQKDKIVSPSSSSSHYRQHKQQINNGNPSHNQYGSQSKHHHSNVTCFCCSGTNHRLYGCPKYNQYNVEDRKNVLKSNKLCFNCLFEGHSIVDCSSSSRCRKCNGKHHTSIHVDNQQFSKNSQSSSSEESGNAQRKFTALCQTKYAFSSLNGISESSFERERISKNSSFSEQEQQAVNKFWENFQRRQEIEIKLKQETLRSKNRVLESSNQRHTLEDPDRRSDLVKRSSTRDNCHLDTKSKSSYSKDIVGAMQLVEITNRARSHSSFGSAGIVEASSHQSSYGNSIKQQNVEKSSVRSYSIANEVVNLHKEIFNRFIGWYKQYIDWYRSAYQRKSDGSEGGSKKVFKYQRVFSVKIGSNVHSVVKFVIKFKLKPHDSIISDRDMRITSFDIYYVQNSNICRYFIVDKWFMEKQRCHTLDMGHFLIGEAPISIPESNLLNENVSRLSRWNLIQRIFQEFWKIWHKEYLSRLQQRPKWLKTQENIQVGQLVLLREEDSPPSKWPVARILEVYPDSDGKVRVVKLEKHATSIKPPIPKDFKKYLAKLKTRKSIFKRNVSKISVLPIEENQFVK